MRALSMRRRYERTLPIVLALVVASAVTAAIALLVLPDDAGDGDGDGAEIGLMPDTEVDPSPAAEDRGGEVPDPPSPTETPEATAVPTEPPTPTARGIRRPTPTPTPTPTSGPVLAERNFVANGSFSDGLDGWYVEGDVGVVDGLGRSGGPAVRIGEGGGYLDVKVAVEPGKTYRLQAWGNVSLVGDSGEVGIVYSDRADNRLEGEEPEPLLFDETTLTRRSMRFTPPDGAAIVRVYVWKNSESTEFIVDDISVRQFVTTG
jgi:hypothetical protein